MPDVEGASDAKNFYADIPATNFRIFPFERCRFPRLGDAEWLIPDLSSAVRPNGYVCY